MGVETAQRAPHPTSPRIAPPDNQRAHHAVPSEDEFAALFDAAVKRAPTGDTPDKTMTKDEQTKFLHAMGDPEFRALLNDYMQEIADPANRAETETYLAQLERDHKVPDDKTLLKPTPGFVVKTKWNVQDKLFVNICSSEKLQPPSSTKVDGGLSGSGSGTSWSLPYSVGPERMEASKSGAPVVTYDVCFHPRTLQFATLQKPYRDMVVKTCLDAVEPLVRKSQKKPLAEVSRDYHVLKGVMYKSGEPVTMCLSTPSGRNHMGKAERLELKGTEETEEEEEKAMLHEATAVTKPLIEEVTTAQTASGKAEKLLPALEYRVVYRGKFEMLDHMQATHQRQETPTRPRELVVEISFPSLSSAKNIALDVNDRAVKVETTGYAPLEVQLPFAVVEEKGRATFDKKARKLVVTLPVHPPEPVPVKRMAIVEQGETEDEAEEDDHTEEETVKEQVQRPTSVKETTSSVPKDDTFARLRETASMVANDPLYQSPAVADAKQLSTTRANGGAREESLDQTVQTYVAEDASFADLPPLESWSEDDDDIEMDLEDTLAMDTPRRAPPTNAIQNGAVPSVTQKTASVPVPATRIARKIPSFAVKEATACLSYLLDVPKVDAASVELSFPSKTSFQVRFSTADEPFELRMENLSAEIDPTRSEFHVASENLVIILYKVSVGREDTEQRRDAVASTSSPSPPPPVVRFQNDLLYDID